MGCCGNCGGEAPNHIKDHEQDKDIEIEQCSEQATNKEAEIEET